MENEIPEDMVRKAATVISELRETENGLVLSSHIAEAALEAAGVPAWLARLSRVEAEMLRRITAESEAWQRILEAMGEDGNEDGGIADRACRLIVRQRAHVAELESAIAERDEAYRKVIAGECAPDERHCSCVPHLRQRIAEMEAASKTLRNELVAKGEQIAGCIATVEARLENAIKKLNTENKR